MKQTFFICFLLSIAFLNASINTTLYVDGNNTTGLWLGSEFAPYGTIQEGVDVALNTAGISEIIVFDGIYHENVVIDFDYSNPKLEKIILRSEKDNPLNCTLSGWNSGTVISILGGGYWFNNKSCEINGFEITNGESGISLMDMYFDYNITIDNCRIHKCEQSILLTNTDYFDNSTFGLNSSTLSLKNNNLYRNKYAVKITDLNSQSTFDVKLNYNTIANNDYGIYSDYSLATFSTTSGNIFWDNTISDIYYSVPPPVGTFGLSYNCIEDLSTLPPYITLIPGNIDDDPIFTDPSSDDYSLQISSPCIDAGEYTNLDLDGTIADMGYKYYDQVTDSRTLKGDSWNWISFPRLRVDSSDKALSWKVLTIMQPSLPSSVTVLDDDPTSSGQTYGGINPQWLPIDYKLNRISGYKINCPSTSSLPLTVPGERVAENTPVALDAEVENWVGYFCANSSSPEAALAAIWNNFQMVKHKDWTYYRTTPGGTVYKLLTSGSVRPGFRYGDMAVIKVYNQQNLIWNYDSVPILSHPASEIFTYEEKADYTPIHVELEEGTDATEVGVFVGEECIGFGIVTEDEAMIRAYLDETRDGGGELDFVYFNGGRSQNSASNYTVYDQQLKAMVKRKIDSSEGREFYNVSLKRDGSSEMVPNPELTMTAFPNPFNPTTHISFYAPETENAKVEIFNIKGQKVKTLFDGIAHSGKNLLVWNGIDDANQAVGSGIYFCRITTAHEETSKKLMLLK